MTLNRIWLFGLVAAVFCASVLSGCGGDRRPRTAHDPYRFIRDHNLERLPRFDIPIELNDRVVAWMEYFQGPGKKHFRRYLERSGRYIPLMQEILKKNKMPADLVYIALIESGFNTQARSWANAVGPWQFISATGKRYGMRIDSYVDERRDPYRSTQAAVDYFRDLYGEFKDWYLAMAGYNAGEGRVRRAIASTGSRNFWEIAADRKALRPETRDYVPKYIAAAIMAKMPERFGFERIDYKPSFDSDYETASVDTQTDLGVIARCAGVTEEDIFDLNPHLVRGTTPPGSRDYEIRVPRGKVRTFNKSYAALSPEERIQTTRYVVRKGDTLYRVAKRYGVSTSALAEANGLNSKRSRLRTGSTLTIPSGKSARYAGVSSGSKSKSSKTVTKSAVHKVRKGETLSTIARKYGVSVKQLMAWNRIKDPRRVHSGKRLKVRVSSVKSDTKVASSQGSSASSNSNSSGPAQMHKVAKGETLSTIASRYGVTVSQLLALNGMTNPRQLKYGKRIAIRQAKDSPKRDPEEPSAEVAKAPSSSGKTSSGKGSLEHKVGKGDTLGGIAARHGVTTKQLIAMNDIKDPRRIRPGQKLVIKRAKPVEAKADRKKAPAEEGPAATGESDEGSPAESEPKQTNQLTASLSDQVVPLAPQTTAVDLRERDVQSLRKTTNVASAQPVKARAPKATPVPKAGAATKQVSYTVKGGDTLWDIARRHKVSIADIQKWNNLPDPSSVRPGTKLKIKNK